MSGLTRDGTAEFVSRDQIFRRERDREINVFHVQLTTRSRIGNHTRLMDALCCLYVTLTNNPLFDEGQR